MRVSLRGNRGVLRAISGLILLGMLARQEALAVTTQTFTVGATITPGCSVVSGSGGALGALNFGTRTGVQSGQVTTSFVPNASLSLGCTPGVALSMSINGGQNYSTVRNMQRSGGTERVPYRIYSSSTLAANTEIGVNQAVSVAYTDGNNISLAIFGAAQLTGFSPAGNYTDQLTVTLSW
ncbi:Csu type fimbrial protein [Kosakonia calanthes]